MKNNYCSKILAIGAITCFTALMVIVVIQVIFRVFPFASAPSWTEEASRFLLIFTVTFSAPLAIKDNAYVRVDLLLNHLPYNLRRIIDMGTYIILTFFFALLVYYAYLFTKNGIQTSPALRIPMFIPYGSTVIIMVLLSLYSLMKAIEIYNKNERDD